MARVGSVSLQVATYERQARSFVRRVLLSAGRTFRARMNQERIGGGPGSALRVVTGKLKRSFRYVLEETPKGFRLAGSIGQGAPYAGEHEEFGRLEFDNTFDQEASRALEEIRIGLDVLARVGGGRTSVAAASPAASAGIQAIGEHILRKRTVARDAARARRASRWRSIRRGF